MASYHWLPLAAVAEQTSAVNFKRGGLGSCCAALRCTARPCCTPHAVVASPLLGVRSHVGVLAPDDVVVILCSSQCQVQATELKARSPAARESQQEWQQGLSLQ